MRASAYGGGAVKHSPAVRVGYTCIAGTPNCTVHIAFHSQPPMLKIGTARIRFAECGCVDPGFIADVLRESQFVVVREATILGHLCV